MKPLQRFIKTHDCYEGSFEVIDLKNAADYSVRVTKGVNDKSYEQVYHEGKYVWALAKEDQRLLLHD